MNAFNGALVNKSLCRFMDIKTCAKDSETIEGVLKER